VTIKSRGKSRKYSNPKNFDRIDRGKRDKLPIEGRRLDSRYVPGNRKAAGKTPGNSKRRCVPARGPGYPSTNPPLKLDARRLKTSYREEEDAYPDVVAALNPKQRVIICSEGIQWILQFRRGQRHGLPIWYGRSFCTTQDSLLQCVWELCGPVDQRALEVLRSLPERIRRPRDITEAAESDTKDNEQQ
jgi:hypothetical protein